MINERYVTSKVLGITLANNEIKDVLKVVKSYENRGIRWKELLKKL